MFWVQLLRHADARFRPTTFEALLEACPLLLDASAPSRHWRGDLLWSEAARAGWAEPDLQPIPSA